MPYIRTKELPNILQQILVQLGYRGSDVKIEVSEAETPYFSAGEGRRAFAVPLNLLTREYEVHWGNWGGANMFTAPHPPDDPNAPSVEIPANGVLILGSTGYQGSTVIIYVSPKTASPLLPEAPKLTLEELVALFCVRSRRGGEPRRECLREYGVRLSTLDHLVSLQLLKRDARGALQITTAGKNALESGKTWRSQEPPLEWSEWGGSKRPEGYFK